MHFTSEGAQLFQELFTKHQKSMASVDGCLSLELFSDVEKATSFATVSRWKTEQHLETYRNSELFLSIWKKIKPYFSEKAEAFSLISLP
jgi:quinol monooxygenase YgiN